MHPVIEKVTAEIIERSHRTRSAYLNYIDGIAKKGPIRSRHGLRQSGARFCRLQCN